MFMFCGFSCFRATEEEQQAQSKKGLKKQQKEAEKAAKKAEKQAKLVSVIDCCFFCFSGLLFHIRRPLLQLVRLWRAFLLGIVGSGGLFSRRGGKSIHCLSIPVILALFMSTQTKCSFLLHKVHNIYAVAAC